MSPALKRAIAADPTNSPVVRSRAVAIFLIFAPFVDALAIWLDRGEPRSGADMFMNSFNASVVLWGVMMWKFGPKLPRWAFDVFGAVSLASLSYADYVTRGGVALTVVYPVILVFAFLFLPFRRGLCAAGSFLVSSFVSQFAGHQAEGHAGLRDAIAHWLLPAVWATGVGVVVGLLRYWLQRLIEQLDDEAHTDLLTGLANRSRFMQRANEAIDDATKTGNPMALCIVDLDGFKDINDTLGHRFGDVLLRQVGERLQRALRTTDTVARLGGDEFALLLSRCGSASDVAFAMKNVLAEIRKSYLLDQAPVHVEASIGIAMFPDHARSVDVLMQQADSAMYVAKDSHTGAVFHDPLAQNNGALRLTMIGELREAIESEQITLHYQPKVELSTGRVSGVEALARWIHPERGFISPGEFIPIAERTALIHPMTRLVLRLALKQIAEWHAAGRALSVAVNITTANIADPEFRGDVLSMVHAAGVPPHLLELEITESTLMEDRERSLDVLNAFRAVGIRIAIDDFGTGYSSLSYLQNLPADQIKIDQSFVFGMETEESNAIIVRSAVQLAQNLGFSVVAEGVETEAALDALTMLGCDEAQGYYISRPIPIDKLNDWIDLRDVSTGALSSSLPTAPVASQKIRPAN